jgi:hypothetical protein
MHSLPWHFVVQVCNVVAGRNVYKLACMVCVHAQKEDCRTGGGCRAFLLPEYRERNIVQGCYRCLRYIALCRDDVWVHNRSGRFEVAVGDGTRWVGVTD